MRAFSSSTRPTADPEPLCLSTGEGREGGGKDGEVWTSSELINKKYIIEFTNLEFRLIKSTSNESRILVPSSSRIEAIKE